MEVESEDPQFSNFQLKTFNSAALSLFGHCCGQMISGHNKTIPTMVPPLTYRNVHCTSRNVQPVEECCATFNFTLNAWTFPVDKNVSVMQCLTAVSNSRNMTSLRRCRSSAIVAGSVGLGRLSICFCISLSSEPVVHIVILLNFFFVFTQYHTVYNGNSFSRFWRHRQCCRNFFSCNPLYVYIVYLENIFATINFHDFFYPRTLRK